MGQSYGKANRSIANDPDDWEDLDRLERIELYADDRDDRVNFEAIIWKRSQTTETIETIDSCPRNHHFYSSKQELIRPRRCLKPKEKLLKCSHLVTPQNRENKQTASQEVHYLIRIPHICLA